MPSVLVPQASQQRAEEHALVIWVRDNEEGMRGAEGLVGCGHTGRTALSRNWGSREAEAGHSEGGYGSEALQKLWSGEESKDWRRSNWQLQRTRPGHTKAHQTERLSLLHSQQKCACCSGSRQLAATSRKNRFQTEVGNDLVHFEFHESTELAEVHSLVLNSTTRFPFSNLQTTRK